MSLRKSIKNGHVFLVDDDPSVLEGASELLEVNGFTVTCFATGRGCLQVLQSKNCDLVVAAVGVTDADGIELLREVKRMKPWLPVLIVTDQGDVPTAVRAFKAEATGFIEKPVKSRDFLAAVMDALGPMVASNQLLDAPLTRAEMRVLRLILNAHSNRDIGGFLRRSERTIEVHRRHIMGKLGASNIIELVTRSAEKGLVELGIATRANRE